MDQETSSFLRSALGGAPKGSRTPPLLPLDDAKEGEINLAAVQLSFAGTSILTIVLRKTLVGLWSWGVI